MSRPPEESSSKAPDRDPRRLIRDAAGTAVLNLLTAEQAEEALGRLLGEQINFALAHAVAEPDRKFPKGSLACRIQDLVEERRDSFKRGAKQRARQLLGGSEEERRQHFGAFATARSDALDRVRRVSSDPTMKRLLDRAVGQRIRRLRQGLGRQDSLLRRHVEPPLTTVEAVRSPESDQEHSVGRDVSMVGMPETLGFRWSTAEPEADELRWELSEWGSAELLASGKTGPAPSGFHQIDFTRYLPPEAPPEPARYLLRFQPWKRGRLRLIDDASPVGSLSVRERDQPAGRPAAPIRIVYELDESHTTFDFREVYRNLDLYVDDITMVEDQDGPGAEEFWITGFVREILGAGSGREGAGPLEKIRTKYKELEPEPGFRATFRDVVEQRFQLNNPGAPAPDHDWWPRAYVVSLTVWEEDGGDEVSEFVAALSDYLNDWVENDWAEAVIDAFRLLGVELSPLQVQQITALLSAASATTVVGAAVAVAAFVLATITADLADDYYGTRTSVFELPSSESEALHSVKVGGRSGSRLSNGSWRFPSDVIEFKGAAGASSAAAWDGIVEVRLHWEAWGREPLV